MIIGHPASTLNSAGVATAHVIGHVGTVTTTLIGAASEVPVLVEDDLFSNEKQYFNTKQWLC